MPENSTEQDVFEEQLKTTDELQKLLIKNVKIIRSSLSKMWMTNYYLIAFGVIIIGGIFLATIPFLFIQLLMLISVIGLAVFLFIAQYILYDRACYNAISHIKEGKEFSDNIDVPFKLHHERVTAKEVYEKACEMLPIEWQTMIPQLEKLHGQ